MVLLRYSPYGYTPSLAWNATLFSLFTVSFLVHIFQATRTRYWIFYPTLVTGAFIELLGYAARIWSSTSSRQLDPFLMQICLLIMAPVFFSAYVYVVLGTAINRLGAQYSILPPKFYFLTFITADIISLILQAVGGGQAASTARTGLPTQRATDIMVAGIIFQLIAMGVFIACGLDFAVRVVRRKPYGFRERMIAKQADKGLSVEAAERAAGAIDSTDTRAAAEGAVGTGAEGVSTPMSESEKIDQEQTLSKADLKKWWLIMTSVLISSSMILTRGVFRSVELSEGWTGHLVQTEIYQMVLDGIPMVIAVGIFNFLHPGQILGKKTSWRSYY